MKTHGIRISDVVERVVCVTLPEILEEIHQGPLFHWSILYLEAMGHLGEDRSMPVFENQIYNSERGLFILWDDLNLLSKEFYQIIDITIIGCKDKCALRRYKNDQEMYDSCDFVIEMIDSSYWEIFSKNEELIKRLAVKFKKVEIIESDYTK